ncbi:MAG TPA: c-type cytochrome [Steroidobacteraceae bacterium]|nr:c-type cytochrome [Steroidobacteraceae bacterium]
MRRAALLLVMAMTMGFPGAALPAEEEAVGTSLPRDSADAAVIRGSIVFRTYCVLCHGADGRGDGRAAKLYTPRPANLTVSPFGDSYKEMIIRGGGASVGRSSFMPPWGGELSEEQIHDLVSFLRELRKTGKPAD